MAHVYYPVSPSASDLDDAQAINPIAVDAELFFDDNSSDSCTTVPQYNGRILRKLLSSDLPMFAPSSSGSLASSPSIDALKIKPINVALPMFAAISPVSDLADMSDEGSTGGACEDSQSDDAASTADYSSYSRQKPGRKRKGEERKPEDQARIRMLRNRAAAQASRERKRQHAAEMEETNKRLRIDNDELKERAEAAEKAQMLLSNQVELLSKQVNDLLMMFTPSNSSISNEQTLPYDNLSLVSNESNDKLTAIQPSVDLLSDNNSSSLLSVFNHLLSNPPTNDVMASVDGLGGSEVSPMLVQDTSISRQRRPFCSMIHYSPFVFHRYPNHFTQTRRCPATVTPNNSYLNYYLARIPSLLMTPLFLSNVASLSSALTTSAVSVASMWVQWVRTVCTLVLRLCLSFGFYSDTIRRVWPSMLPLNGSFTRNNRCHYSCSKYTLPLRSGRFGCLFSSEVILPLTVPRLSANGHFVDLAAVCAKDMHYANEPAPLMPGKQRLSV
ncbi:hypothetical protein BDF19DRAFT_186353 [Syncephalis fuscata]|nr:hypothetical protein BDF19DRAFT_186353 [Syncephalis fuscata]